MPPLLFHSSIPDPVNEQVAEQINEQVMGTVRTPSRVPAMRARDSDPVDPGGIRPCGGALRAGQARPGAVRASGPHVAGERSAVRISRIGLDGVIEERPSGLRAGLPDSPQDSASRG
ncbi:MULTISPECIES: hypothetical protein [unclassified Streptomyces]|uniref:hypothetical protein n=1 Tax=unclassified Streptomyces TaxID=2593676 RepID=UPI00093B96A6|nr:hypothetical protein [Streptomyces sp. TSRI0281]OKI42715.1 hypothetical protein A6A29_36315 [Streptomyces sp. TSRI0281]